MGAILCDQIYWVSSPAFPLVDLRVHLARLWGDQLVFAYMADGPIKLRAFQLTIDVHIGRSMSA